MLLDKLKTVFRFRYLLLALVVIFVCKHGVSIEFHENDLAERTSHPHLPLPQAQLASLKHIADAPHTKASLRENYISSFSKLAQDEMSRTGIPASITLAQGLLESVAGTSRLARKTNNHFGIKCFSRSCSPGHCTNFDDDHHKDFFRVFQSPAESFKAHSQFLVKGKRYEALFKLDQDDYKAWAHGLRKAGYATDKKYGDKLISLIERYNLHEFDLVP